VAKSFMTLGFIAAGAAASFLSPAVVIALWGAAGTVACGVADASLDCGETPAAFTAATV